MVVFFFFYTQTPALWQRTALPESFRKPLLNMPLLKLPKIASGTRLRDLHQAFGHVYQRCRRGLPPSAPAAFDGDCELYTRCGYILKPFQPWLSEVKPSSWCKSQPDLRGLFVAFLLFVFPSPPPSADQKPPLDPTPHSPALCKPGSGCPKRAFWGVPEGWFGASQKDGLGRPKSAVWGVPKPQSPRWGGTPKND